MAVIIFKPSEVCNSNCLYCGVVEKHRKVVMDYDLLETVFRNMNDYLTAKPGETIHLTWHGGEPCMLGVEYFRKALELQEKHCSRTKGRITHLLQSNLTIITQELIDVFKDMGIDRIGTSFEPLPNIRGFGPERDSDAYNRAFFKGVELLEKNGMVWGFIYVVHKRSLDKPIELFYYLTNMNPKAQPTFNQIYLYQEDKHKLAITPEEYADFLGALLPLYWENRNLYTDLKPVSSFINVIEGRGAMMCDYSGICSHNWMYIGPEGEASHCGRAGDFGFIDYGNIKTRTMIEIMNDKQRDLFKNRQKLLAEGECNGCRLWGMCHGGCPLDAYSAYGDFLRATPNCPGIKRLVENYIEPLTGLSVDMPYFRSI